MTALGSLFAARFFSIHLFVALLGASKSKLICITKGLLTYVDKHSKKPFALHLNRVLKQDSKHEALNL